MPATSRLSLRVHGKWWESCHLQRELAMGLAGLPTTALNTVFIVVTLFAWLGLESCRANMAEFKSRKIHLAEHLNMTAALERGKKKATIEKSWRKRDSTKPW